MDHVDADRLRRTLQGPEDRSAHAQVPSPHAVVPLLRDILDTAVRDVPGAEGAGMTLLLDDPLVRRPRVQSLVGGWGECEEGPCVDAMRARRVTTFLVHDVESETSARWPDYAAAAARVGVRSVLSFVMAPPDATPASVSFYAGRPGELTEQDRATGSVFVIQAAVALYGAAQVGRMLAALETRDVIGRATGILMERFGLDDQQALAMLVSSSQDTNTPLTDIAVWLSTQGKPQVS
ncbi:ANTAR domain-containing protein [Pseudonocardia sp. KRD291]|uniref:ANTAR domain-containing protein n=1 Tax=Pseudonocardia sp. KRD291 TaxID=2792007 RepID=UPI001C4A6413|nr:ANTAR domain-containing protein [Pseudonocardia sp. KRD291]MBW0101144.1 ANTAR domain-containing protein [Pseudonocardia sp. KRD291]